MKLNPLILSEFGVYPESGGFVLIDRDPNEYIYAQAQAGILVRCSSGDQVLCHLATWSNNSSIRVVVSALLENLRLDVQGTWCDGKPAFPLNVVDCESNEVSARATTLLKAHTNPVIVTLTNSCGELLPGIYHAPGETTAIVLAFEAFPDRYPVAYAVSGIQDPRIGLALRTSRLAIFRVPTTGGGSSASPVNDHTCPSCGNTRCSRSEKTCWRCGGKLF